MTLKLVQVYVVDKNGKPVTDLKLEDFELWDDGKPKPLTDFEAHAISLESRLAAAPKAEAPVVPKPENMTRKFFLFFDFAFNTLPGIKESRTTALKFLETQIRPEDEVGVISYHAQKGLTINEYLTTEHAKVREVLNSIKPDAIVSRAQVGDESLKEIADSIKQFGDSTEGAETLLQSEEKLYEVQVKNYIEQMISLSKGLRYIPGLKNIVLFSSGIAGYLLYGRSEAGESIKSDKRIDIGDPGIRSGFRKLCQALASSNCSIFPINTVGVSSFTRSSRDRDDYLGDFALKTMADESGGKYFDNVRNYEQIGAEIQNLTATYYVLGYYVNEKLDGKFHDVKVRVKRKGCEVHGQSGYFNPKPFTEYTENEKTLHLIDLAMSEKPHLQEALDFPVKVMPFALGDKTGLAVIVGIPGASLSEIGGGKIEFVTIAFDDKSNITLVQRKELSRWPRASQTAYAKSLIALPPGEFECRVVVRNTTTGRGARGSVRIVVPDGAAGKPFVFLRPLVLAPADAPIFIGEEETSKEPPLWSLYPFDPAKYVPFMGGPLKASSGVLAVIPCPNLQADPGAVGFEASALDMTTADETPVPVSFIAWAGEGARRTVSMRIDTAGLNPGEYALYISAGAAGAERRTITAGTFELE